MSFLDKNGYFPALVTPYGKDGGIDRAAVDSIVGALQKKGATGFYVGGSTGEVMLLSLQERMDLLEAVMAGVDGKKTDVVAHIGCQTTADSIRLAKHAKACGVNAVSALPPVYFKYSMGELTDFFLDIVNGAGVDLIVYNAPALAGVSFDSGNTGALFANPHIIGMKFTSYDLFQMQRLIAQNPGKHIINGHDELYLSTLPLGTRVAIGSTLNFMPEKFIAIRSAFEEGRMEAALAVQNTVNGVIAGMLEIGVFRAVKGMMNILGMPAGECRKPFSPLSREEYGRLEILAKQL